MSSAADVIGTLSVNSETSRLPVKLNFTTNNSKSFHGSKMMLICLTHWVQLCKYQIVVWEVAIFAAVQKCNIQC